MQSLTPVRTEAELNSLFDTKREINPRQILRARRFVSNYAIARRCIEEYEKMIGIMEATITFEAGTRINETVGEAGGAYPELHSFLYEKFIVPVLRASLVNYLQYGFSWFCTKPVWVDASIDREWMNRFKEIKDKDQQPYKTLVRVPIVPDVDDVRFFTCSRVGEAPVVCALFKSEYKPTLPFLHVTVWKQPDHSMGAINSPAASMLPGFYRLMRLEALTVTAAIALANPITITEFYKADGAQGDLHTTVNSSRLSAIEGFVVTDTGALEPGPERTITQLEYTKALHEEMNRGMLQTQQAYAQAMAGASSWLDDDQFLTEEYIRDLPNSATRLTSLPPQQRIGSQPRPPVPPAELQTAQNSFRSEVAASFGVPMQRLNFAMPHMIRTQEAIDQSFVSTMDAMARSLAEMARVVYASTFGARVHISFPLHVGMPPIPNLVELVKNGIIPPEEAAMAVRQTQGLSGVSLSEPTRVVVQQASAQGQNNKRKSHDAMGDHSLLFPEATKALRESHAQQEVDAKKKEEEEADEAAGALQPGDPLPV